VQPSCSGPSTCPEDRPWRPSKTLRATPHAGPAVRDLSRALGSARCAGCLRHERQECGSRRSPGRSRAQASASSTERQISITIQRSSVPLRWCAGRVRAAGRRTRSGRAGQLLRIRRRPHRADLERKTLSIVRQPNGACRADPKEAEKTDTSKANLLVVRRRTGGAVEPMPEAWPGGVGGVRAREQARRRPQGGLVPLSGPSDLSVTSGDVKVTTHGGVVTVTIDRPAKRNAITQAMYATMADALAAADADTGIGAVVVTGVGDVFTAGNDLDDFASGGALDSPSASFRPSPRSACRSSLPSTDWPSVSASRCCCTATSSTSSPTRALRPLRRARPGARAASSLLLPRVIGERHAPTSSWRGAASTAPRQQHGDWRTPRSPRPSTQPCRRRSAWRRCRPTPCGRPRCCCAPTSERSAVDGRGDARVRRGTEGPEFAQVIAERRRPR